LKSGFLPGISEVKCFNPLEEVMKICVMLSAFMMFLLPEAAMARNSDKAIMLTVFGTSTEASVTFDELLPRVRQRFPGRDVVVPYTSGVIRNKLNAGIADPAKKILSPAEMLEKLKKDGYTDIAVISTLLFAGVEHDKLKGAVDRFGAANKNIKVAYVMPLLSEPGRLDPVVGVLGKYMLEDGSNVVVAHGTHEGHPAEKTYLELADQVASRYPNARVGSIEGVPDMKETLKWLEGRKEENARFIVFMFVAGDHAENDIASDEDDSLFSAARAMGKSPSVQSLDTTDGKRIASLGLDPDYRALLLEHFGRNIVQ
jgi:sirohydrochlorin cobaltochelatase